MNVPATGILLEAVRRTLPMNEPFDGTVDSRVAGISVVCATGNRGLVHAISRPLACFVLQGSKRVAVAAQSCDFSAGESLIISANVATVSQVTHATASLPYVSVVLQLDLGVISTLLSACAVVDAQPPPLLEVAPADTEVMEVLLRLFRLMDRPNAIAMLGETYVRELHYWLLTGKHGPTLHALARQQSRSEGIVRAVDLLREQFARALSIQELAYVAGMSESTFHHHFRLNTATTPLQFQKQLRLIEAKRLISLGELNASRAAYQVGYESIHQFTREYHRMFGKSPMRDKVVETPRSPDDLGKRL